MSENKDHVIVKTSLGEYLVKMNVMYTETDEWVKLEGNMALVGISDYAQKKLRNIVNVELPNIGRYVRRGESIATIESIKAIADLYAPLSGKIIEVNNDLIIHPEYINEDPYGKGWIVKLKADNMSEVSNLLLPEKYVEKIMKEK